MRLFYYGGEVLSNGGIWASVPVTTIPKQGLPPKEQALLWFMMKYEDVFLRLHCSIRSGSPAIGFVPGRINILPFCPVGGGRTAEMLSELRPKVAAAAKAAALGDVGDGKLCLEEQLACHLQPDVLQAVRGGGVQAGAKAAVIILPCTFSW